MDFPENRATRNAPILGEIFHRLLTLLFLALFAIGASADDKEKGEVVFVVDATPCNGGLQLIWRDEQGKILHSTCIKMGGGEGFGSDNFPFPIDPCAWMEGLCKGAKPGDSGPDDDEDDMDVEIIEECNDVQDVFIAEAGEDPIPCGMSNFYCDGLGSLITSQCLVIQTNFISNICSSGVFPDGSQMPPNSCVLLHSNVDDVGADPIWETFCASDGDKDRFERCINRVSSMMSIGTVGSSSIMCEVQGKSASEACSASAEISCRSECVSLLPASGIRLTDMPLEDMDESTAFAMELLSARDPKGVILLEGISYAYQAVGDDRSATRIMKFTTELYPKDARAWKRLTDLYERMGLERAPVHSRAQRRMIKFD